ncbi:hypothetical protein ACIRD2_17185 [Streptomyces sp. NPDC093595]|uniref:hypothetical protein n=1 Tax=Streptomyces sp. NPDC093595 TaxID=3366045 RepID=UPI0037F96EBC
MKRSISLALSTSVALGALAVPGTAFAAPAGPAAKRVGGHTTEFGHLFVDDLTADSDVTAISAVVHKSGDDTALATAVDFQLASGSRKSGDWTTKDEVRLEAAGAYSVDLVVKEADGDETTLKNAGTYDYTAKRYFAEFGVDKPHPTLDDQKVTAQGRLLQWQPVTHERTPVADVPVTIRDTTFYDWTSTVTTDADGRFSHWFIAGRGPVPVHASQGGVRSATVTVTPKALPARITVDQKSFSGTYGAPLKVTGKVEYQSKDGTWKTTDYADVNVEDDEGRFNGLDTTDADGRFSVDARVPYSGTKLRARASYGGWFANEPVVPLTVRTLATTKVEDFEIKLSAYHELTVNGRVEIEGAPLPHRTVDIHVSPNGKDGWKKLSTVSMGTWGSQFLNTVKAPPTGYYRAHYTGGPNVPAATSAVLYAGRAETRIKDYKVAPAAVKKGGSVKITGTLLHRTPSWKAYGGKKVIIYFRPKAHPKQSFHVTTVKSAANGTFTTTVKERGDGWFFALHQDADDKHLVNQEVAGYVDVK